VEDHLEAETEEEGILPEDVSETETEILPD